MGKRGSKGHRWTNEELLLEALKYQTRSEFAKESPYAYNALRKEKLLDKACSHMIGKLHFWKNEELRVEALKYKTRYEFQLGSRNAHAAAQRRGILDQICSHMKSIFIFWAFEELEKEASKYNSRREFEIKGNSAYQASGRMGILDRICKHMQTPRGTSSLEKELMSRIKKQHPSAKKFKDTRVTIEGKPYIKGFELDIKLGNKAIEFDGEYWHSFNGLRKGRNKKNWPIEDLHNYHQIKDEYFLSQGIQVLHIKEEDWNLNKESCIKRCLEFLGNSNER